MNPEINVLIISGYTRDEDVMHVMAGGGKGFLLKPFTASELSQELTQILNKE